MESLEATTDEEAIAIFREKVKRLREMSLPYEYRLPCELVKIVVEKIRDNNALAQFLAR